MSKTEQKMRTVGDYQIKETLGKGGYSWVKKGLHSKTGDTVALKFMSRAEKSWEKEQAAQVRTEIKSMVRIQSPNVMKLYAYNLNCKYPTKDGNTLNTVLLVLEFCPGGELFDVLYYTQQLDEITARTYFVQMITGLKVCHDAGIIHRDIKPQNLLMDAQFQLKITDFGLSKLCKDKDADKAVMKTHYVGTRGYQAPELLKKKRYSKACDIFSAGVVLFILLTGYPPFEQAVKEDRWYKPIAVNDPDKFWELHKGCGVRADARELITQMFSYQASDRITLENILESKFVMGKTHSPKELYKVLKKRHRETSKRRKKDKRKMREMENSIKKKRTKDLFDEWANQLSGGLKCPMKKFEVRQSLMTKRWVVRPKYSEQAMSEGDQKDERSFVPREVVEAYIVVMQALECKGMSVIHLAAKDNPWDLICTASDIDRSKYRINLTINHDEHGVYYFNFKRIGGNALRFHKFWKSVEIYFMHSEYLKDELVEEDDEDEELEEMKIHQADNEEAVQIDSQKANTQNEDEQKRDDNEEAIQIDLQKANA